MTDTDNTTNTNIAGYEMMFILVPDLGEQKTGEEVNEIKKLITSNGGKITHEDTWGIREFAYRIKKQDKGFYVVLNFSMESEKVKTLDKPLVLNQNIIRYIVIKTPTEYEIKTLAEYEEEKVKREAEAKKKEAEKENKKGEGAKKVYKKKEEPKEKMKEEPKKEPKKESKDEPKEEPKKEAKEEPKDEPKEDSKKKKEEKAKAEEQKAKLDEVDERLKSIINDPDISL